MRPAAELNYQLAGLVLPAEQARATWHALQAAEQHTTAATAPGAKVSAASAARSPIRCA
jgi:hypothetical protein